VMLLRRLAYPGTTGLIYRRVYDDLKKNHIDKFFEEFPALFKFYRATDHEIVLPAQPGKAPSRIVFAYAETEAEVKRKFHGPEFMDMFIDQAEQLTEQELKIMKTCNRWPGVNDRQCKFVLFFNPGGIGISFFKRIFKDRKYQGNEYEDDYEFIHAYGWDNVEWARSALIQDGKTEEDFYAWTDKERFDYFVGRTQYGKVLDSLPQAMRVGHLMGTFDTPAGQYFDVWNPDLVVKNPVELNITSWLPKWISIDWGFAHDSAVYWHAQDGPKTKTYRELVESGLGPRALATKILEQSNLLDEVNCIDAIYISPDAFAKRTTEDSVAKQIGDVLVEHGLPRPRRADDERVSGWMLMHEMLQYNTWEISSRCEKLIDCIPMFTRDEDEPEDCVKFLGDDPGDSARYGLKSRFSGVEPPKEVQFANMMTDHVRILREKGRTQAEINTSSHIKHLKFDEQYKKKHAPIRRIRVRGAR
jgi:phage terminase large subunit